MSDDASYPDPRLAARNLLRLRSQAAMGLRALPVRPRVRREAADAPVTPRVDGPPPTERRPRPAAEPPAPASTPGPSSDLFAEAGPTPARAAPFDTAVLSREERGERLRVLDETQVRGCTRCELHEGRTNTVFGEGDPEARLMFVGEGPGENEDRTGRPFVGRAGELLDKMVVAMGLAREDVYIANVVKCRPPGNRTPRASEVATCTQYLDRQLEWIRPRVVVALGLPAARHLLGTTQPMGRIRGRWFDWRGLKVMPTYHPAYLLRSYTPENRRLVWDDLREVMRYLGGGEAAGEKSGVAG